jgi:epoxide hydrolase 4
VGDADAPLILFLHGFPEYSGAWKEVLPTFADRFHAVAPDQRGYALSAKPVGVEASRTKQLLHDVLALADRLSPDRPFSIVAHDWGASVAYATAIAAPPGPFQGALVEEEAQRGDSAYMHELHHPQAEERLSANRYEKLLGVLSRFGPQPWLTPAKAAGYLATWSAPGALTGMLNWYRATPLLVPKVGERVDLAALPKLDPDRLRVRMPHLLIWGMQDQRCCRCRGRPCRTIAMTWRYARLLAPTTGWCTRRPPR